MKKVDKDSVIVILVIIIALLAYMKANQLEVENGFFPSEEELEDLRQLDDMRSHHPNKILFE